MPFHGQSILPAVRGWKEFDALLASPYDYIVMLDCKLGQLKSIVSEAGRHGKKLLLHADLIDGLNHDEHAAEFLCQSIRPAGIISTRTTVIQKTKQNGLIAIQRMFLLDTGALERGIALAKQNRPDYIEVLPGVIPPIIREVAERTGIPALAGGLIRTEQDVAAALEAGAAAVTTSDRQLWKPFINRKQEE
ncbi:glycerol-3-phosphate responsive antiterminator [Paenibacillus sp. MMS18-CY102]|uniref:glycerol-3-phosphate responsive antiterminator n=1 Tax=Paenibacillus sp. MMS18-CY102 TaxID=2682849 RepID=UPI001366466E|nr:glycerol-3-phosphate responsive antiterminator [Paenibacillus sp. MMS18-CY102]MWC30035.1 glycerol-3-phosphate responsive antiterminator GlpP [Paenibacillus sp. MMS18-CY102]